MVGAQMETKSKSGKRRHQAALKVPKNESLELETNIWPTLHKDNQPEEYKQRAGRLH